MVTAVGYRLFLRLSRYSGFGLLVFGILKSYVPGLRKLRSFRMSGSGFRKFRDLGVQG